MTKQTYIVLIHDGQIALAVAAALQDWLDEDGAGGLALIPARRADFTSPAGLDHLRRAVDLGATEPRVVALYEDGLLGALESLGLCAYVAVPKDQDWRVLHFNEAGGAMLLPVGTARDLVEAVADYSPWDDYATAAVTPIARRAARRPRLAHVGPLSRRLAIVGVAVPLLTVGLPAAVAAAAPQAPPVSSTASSPVSIPAQGTPPAQVTAWWNSLTQAQKVDVTNSNLSTIGNMNGIPPTARDYANRQSLYNALDPNNPNSLQNLIQNSQNTPAELDRLQTLLDGARALQQQIGLPDSPNLHDTAQPPQSIDVNTTNPVTVSDHAPTYLLNFDTDGLGHFSFSIGDIATAQNVTTFVPGMLTSMSALNVNWYAKAMDGLYNQASAAAQAGTSTDTADRNTAVVFWYGPGYDSPQGMDARLPAAAQAAAPSLQQFQAAVVSTNIDPSSLNLAVVCHSYGGPVCGAATDGDGLYANSMTLLGTPGTGKDSAAALAAGMISPDPNSIGGQGQIFATRNDHDVISLAGGGNLIPGFAPNNWPLMIGGHGMDPTNPQFGATEFESGPGIPGDFMSNTPNLFSGLFFNSRDSHSLYPLQDPNNPAFSEIVNIMIGNWTAVTPPSRTINPPPREQMDDSGQQGTNTGAPPTNQTLNSPPVVIDPQPGGGGAGFGIAGGVSGMTGTQSGRAANPPGNPPQDPAAGKQGNNADPATPNTATQTDDGQNGAVKTAADDGPPPGNGQTVVQTAPVASAAPAPADPAAAAPVAPAAAAPADPAAAAPADPAPAAPVAPAAAAPADPAAAASAPVAPAPVAPAPAAPVAAATPFGVDPANDMAALNAAALAQEAAAANAVTAGRDAVAAAGAANAGLDSLPFGASTGIGGDGSFQEAGTPTDPEANDTPPPVTVPPITVADTSMPNLTVDDGTDGTGDGSVTVADVGTADIGGDG